jgi:hypothetical protein
MLGQARVSRAGRMGLGVNFKYQSSDFIIKKRTPQPRWVGGRNTLDSRLHGNDKMKNIPLVRNGENLNFKNDVTSALSMGYKSNIIRKLSGFEGLPLQHFSPLRLA